LEALLIFLGPWGILLLGVILGLSLGAIPLYIRNTRLEIQLEAQAKAAQSEAELRAQMGEQMRHVATQALQENQQTFLALA